MRSMMYRNNGLNILALTCALLFCYNLNGQEAMFDASEELLEIQALLISESEMDTIVSKVLRSSYQPKAEEQIASLNKEEN